MGNTTSTAISSSELGRDVLDELNWEPSVNAAHIGVAVKDGVVALTGHVDSYAEKHGAEKAARRVCGVRTIANQIDVRLPGGSRRTDQELAEAVAGVLQGYPLAPAGTIKATVEKGQVTLEGEVVWQFQKAAAERAVRNQRGVVDVTSLIKVKPRVPGRVAWSAPGVGQVDKRLIVDA